MDCYAVCTLLHGICIAKSVAVAMPLLTVAMPLLTVAMPLLTVAMPLQHKITWQPDITHNYIKLLCIIMSTIHHGIAVC